MNATAIAPQSKSERAPSWRLDGFIARVQAVADQPGHAMRESADVVEWEHRLLSFSFDTNNHNLNIAPGLHGRASFFEAEMALEKLYWRWRTLAERLWEYAEEAEGREQLRREIPASIAEEIVNALARAYHQKVPVWKLLEHRKNYAVQSYKAAPHLWERRQSAALFRLLRMQIRSCITCPGKVKECRTGRAACR